MEMRTKRVTYAYQTLDMDSNFLPEGCIKAN